MTGYGSFLIFTASTCEFYRCLRRSSRCTDNAVLQLAVKVSPDAYDYDESSWIPTVHRVAGNPGAASVKNSQPTVQQPVAKPEGASAKSKAGKRPISVPSVAVANVVEDAR